MSLPPRAAAVRGDDYHYAVAWLWVCKMLHPSEMISSVAVEDAAGGAFDDVVVRRRAGGDVYIQAKSSNYGDKIVDRAWLLTPRTAGGASPLQRFYDTYVRLAEAGERFTLQVWTIRGFDHANPLLGRLLDKRHDKITTGRMLAEGARSKVGMERDEWAAHLQVSAESLAAFLDAVRWKHTASELDIRLQTRPYMRLAGLRDDDGALAAGIGVVRDWAKDGLGAQTPADAGRRVAAMRLTAPDPLTAFPPSDGSSLESGLPPGCRQRIDELRDASPELADRVADLLSRRSSLVPGVLAQLADEPLDWMVDADGLVWEALAEFVQAHGLPGLSEMHGMAIDSGSPRSTLYKLHLAVAAAAEGDPERVEELLREVPSDHPLVGAVKAHIGDDAEAVIAAINASRLHESDDLDLALYGSELLGWAYWHLDELESAGGVLRRASDRFPGRGFLLLQQARFKLKLSQRRNEQTGQEHELVESAVELALRARDELRSWRGPSAQAVSVAASGLIVLDDPQRVCDVAMVPPEGEAVPEEAQDPGVVECLAHALLRLGRVDKLDELDLELVGDSDESLIRAMQARSRGDADALDLMRAAVERAEDHRALMMALEGLAQFGETHEAALANLDGGDGADADLIRASAAYHRGDYAAAVALLVPCRCRSAEHADLLAICQRKSGALDEACKTLLECAEALDDPSLNGSAVTLLIEVERYEEAERVALGALARNPSRRTELSLRRSLVEVAAARQDWAAMEQYGRDLFRRFPDDSMGPWSVVYALHQQARYREAWGYLVEHDLSPDHEDAALLAVGVFVAIDAPAQDADRLLRIARAFVDSEEVAGNAIAVLMIGKGGRVPLSDAQLSEFRGLVAEFEQRYPESSVLRRVSFDGEEQWREMIREQTQQWSLETDPIINHVRHGRMPYGMLQVVGPVPYAESLQLRAAGYLTAISTDPATRERERATARAAIGDVVAVDTSVAVVGLAVELDLQRLAAAFTGVLVADELLMDARDSVRSAGTPAAGYAGYEPLVDEVVVSRVEEGELEQAVQVAQQVLSALGRWQRVSSARIQPDGHPQEECLRPWDASLRVALDRGCALWCDDVALRHLAETEGIATFGTYALYEVLAVEQGGVSVPPAADLKMRLLRAYIADVPVSLKEIQQASDDRDGADVAVGRFLGRPFIWSDPPSTLDWYLKRVTALSATTANNEVADLLFSASCGLGAAVTTSDRPTALGRLLAATLWTVRDPATVPMLIMCSRYAARREDATADVDPLPDAVRDLLTFLEAETEAADAPQMVLSLFSQAESADRRAVAAVVIEDR